jgi:DNA-binding NarL/FixJ family response regulator
MSAAAQTVLIDDHPMFRAGLRTLLSRDARLQVVAEASSASEAIALAATHAFDVAVVDVVIPDIGGPALVRQLRALRPTSKILGLSMLDEPVRVAEMLRAGASGYALKTQPIEEIREAIHAVLGDVRYLAPQIAHADLQALLATDAPFPLETLTPRERVVFDLLVRGGSNEHIARQLEIARCTVETHRRHIMQKLAASSIVDLVHLALRHGLIGHT